MALTYINKKSSCKGKSIGYEMLLPLQGDFTDTFFTQGIILG